MRFAWLASSVVVLLSCASCWAIRSIAPKRAVSRPSNWGRGFAVNVWGPDLVVTVRDPKGRTWWSDGRSVRNRIPDLGPVSFTPRVSALGQRLGQRDTVYITRSVPWCELLRPVKGKYLITLRAVKATEFALSIWPTHSDVWNCGALFLPASQSTYRIGIGDSRSWFLLSGPGEQPDSCPVHLEQVATKRRVRKPLGAAKP
jgi:hypothetical protein